MPKKITSQVACAFGAPVGAGASAQADWLHRIVLTAYTIWLMAATTQGIQRSRLVMTSENEAAGLVGLVWMPRLMEEAGRQLRQISLAPTSTGNCSASPGSIGSRVGGAATTPLVAIPPSMVMEIRIWLCRLIGLLAHRICLVVLAQLQQLRQVAHLTADTAGECLRLVG
ncbi:unnamed protein product [Protopolystoma xenopodis]|uniref:Uncharacterized protein n=1 Tax=Protopolystoma xenopodis TaxID=117903 RepID=A0A3S5BYZ8_9PLAT|nr:unnamed protein product [Protopolystoma xenopodis]